MKQKPSTKCECLDFVEAANRHKVYPLMYCHMKTEGNLDVNRLQAAVSCSCQYVPEMLYIYDFERGSFIDNGFTASDTIKYASDPPQWQLDKKPQFQMILNSADVIDMSHILTDGGGFLQYLYLLASLYNEQHPVFLLENCRDISCITKNILVGRATEQTRYGKRITVPPLRAYSDGKQYFCLNSQIDTDSFNALYSKARPYNVTLINVFLTAYILVIARLQEIQTETVPCPADLRGFLPMPDRLSIANMTGIYRRITIEIKPRHTFSQTLSLVHIEMKLQKSRYRCFAGIQLLDCVFHKVAHRLLVQSVIQYYQLPPVSYTNFGKIDHNKLSFKNCCI